MRAFRCSTVTVGMSQLTINAACALVKRTAFKCLMAKAIDVPIPRSHVAFSTHSTGSNETASRTTGA